MRRHVSLGLMVVMDPLKVFWVFTNSTFLGKLKASVKMPYVYEFPFRKLFSSLFFDIPTKHEFSYFQHRSTIETFN